MCVAQNSIRAIAGAKPELRCDRATAGIEVMPGRLDSSLRFIDIKTLCLENPSDL